MIDLFCKDKSIDIEKQLQKKALFLEQIILKQSQVENGINIFKYINSR